jgi:hypothetical protein
VRPSWVLAPWLWEGQTRRWGLTRGSGGWAGKYSQADLGVYEGEFKNNSFNGQGSAGDWH